MNYDYYCKGCEGGVFSEDGITFYCGCREEVLLLDHAYTEREYNTRPVVKFKNDWGETEKFTHKGFVYIIKMAGTNMYKVGISKDPEARLGQLQIGNPFKLTIVNRFSDSKPKLLEHVLHLVLSDKNKRGEWFELTKSEYKTLVLNIKASKGVLWGGE